MKNRIPNFSLYFTHNELPTTKVLEVKYFVIKTEKIKDPTYR